MTEKLVAWLCLVVLVVFVVTFSGQRWRLDNNRPIITPVQYVNALRATSMMIIGQAPGPKNTGEPLSGTGARAVSPGMTSASDVASDELKFGAE